jgi:hypothetical protein
MSPPTRSWSAAEACGKVTASTGAVASLVGKTLSLDVAFTAVPSSGCVSTDLVKATTTNYNPLTIG